jgi:hypothetical protein
LAKARGREAGEGLPMSFSTPPVFVTNERAGDFVLMNKVDAG